MKIIAIAFSLLLTNSVLAGTWERSETNSESIRFTAKHKKVTYSTIMITNRHDGIQVSLNGENRAEIIIPGAMNKLQELYEKVRKHEPRVQNFVGLVKMYFGKR